MLALKLSGLFSLLAVSKTTIRKWPANFLSYVIVIVFLCKTEIYTVFQIAIVPFFVFQKDGIEDKVHYIFEDKTGLVRSVLLPSFQRLNIFLRTGRFGQLAFISLSLLCKGRADGVVGSRVLTDVCNVISCFPFVNKVNKKLASMTITKKKQGCKCFGWTSSRNFIFSKNHRRLFEKPHVNANVMFEWLDGRVVFLMLPVILTEHL